MSVKPLIYSVVQVLFPCCSLSPCSIHYWKWGVEASNYYCYTVYFFFHFWKLLLHILGAVLLIAYLHIWYIFLMDWPCYHYELSLFSAAAAAKSLQLCPTLCNPIDGSPPGSPVPGILQARTLEWVATSFPNAWKWKVKMKLLSRVQLLATSWTAAYQAPPSMGFSRQEY